MENIHPFIHRKIVVLNQDCPAQDAARAMRDNRIGCVLVTDGEGRIGGIVTDRDFASRLAADYDVTTVALLEIMTPNVVSARPDVGLADVIRLMERHAVRRIPLIEKGPGGVDKCVGIVTLDDLVASRHIDPNAFSRIVQRQIGRRVLEGGGAPRGARAESRAEARTGQTLRQFYDRLAREAGLTPDKVTSVTSYLIGSLAMRLSPVGAAHLAAQLPLFIRSYILALPPGPDRSITAAKLASELVARYQFSEDYARTLLHRFYSGLGRFIDKGEVEHMTGQLPADLVALFTREAAEVVESELVPEERRRVVMPLTSSAFADGGEIPRIYSGEGADRSPPLEWSSVPVGTREFALICEDPDAPGNTPYVHWVIYGISGATTGLPEGLPSIPALDVPIRARQGKNSAGTSGYEGPMPPKGHGWHHYYFKLYALDQELPLPPGASRDELVAAMRGHVLAEAVLMGRYKRETARKAG